MSGGWAEFAYHAELNFSSVHGEGIYVIEFGSGRSPQFSIRGNVHADIADQLLEFMRQQRCGYPAKDQLYHQVADDRDHKGFRLPQNETVDYGWGPGSYRVVYFAEGRPQG